MEILLFAAIYWAFSNGVYDLGIMLSVFLLFFGMANAQARKGRQL